MKKVNIVLSVFFVASVVFVCPLFAQQCKEAFAIGENYFERGKKAESFRQYFDAIEMYMMAEGEFQKFLQREDCADAHLRHMAEVNLTFSKQNVAKNRALAIERKPPNDFEAGVLKYEQGVRFAEREQWRHALMAFEESVTYLKKAYQTTPVTVRKIEKYEKQAAKEAKKIRKYLGKE